MSLHSAAWNTSDILNEDNDNHIDENIDYSLDKTVTTSDNLTISLVISSSTNLTVIFFYWTYLLYSSFSLSTTWPPLFPHLLLLGIFLGSSSNLASITIDPSSLFSSSNSILIPLSYSLIYSTLLVRLVYLHSLHKAMYMLPTIYQTLLLLFCVLVQISVSTQSLIFTQLKAPNTSISSIPFPDLLSLSYSFFLLLSITCISTGIRRRRENGEEARSIWAFSLLSILVWLAWVAVSLVFEEHYTVIKSEFYKS